MRPILFATWTVERNWDSAGTWLLVYKNFNCTYPIRGVADDVPGVSDRTAKKGWMYRTVFRKCLADLRAIPSLHNGNQIVLYIDKCSDMMSVSLHGTHW